MSDVTDIEYAPIRYDTPLAPPASLSETIAEAPLPLPPGANIAAPPADTVPAPVLHVAFVGDTKKGKQRFGRELVTGLFDLTNTLLLRQTEAAIGDQRGLANVEVLSWRVLPA